MVVGPLMAPPSWVVVTFAMIPAAAYTCHLLQAAGHLSNAVSVALAESTAVVEGTLDEHPDPVPHTVYRTLLAPLAQNENEVERRGLAIYR